MASRAKQTITNTTTKVRVKKNQDKGDFYTCPICSGKGQVPKGYNKKKK